MFKLFNILYFEEKEQNKNYLHEFKLEIKCYISQMHMETQRIELETIRPLM